MGNGLRRDDTIRTCDHTPPRRVLYHLSYIPMVPRLMKPGGSIVRLEGCKYTKKVDFFMRLLINCIDCVWRNFAPQIKNYAKNFTLWNKLNA